MKALAAITAALFLTGCQTLGKLPFIPSPDKGPKPPGDINSILIDLPGTVGVFAIFAGLVLGIFTRFTLGIGMALIGAGFGMVLLAFFFSHPLLPWLALGTLLLFAGYKIYRLHFCQSREGILD